MAERAEKIPRAVSHLPSLESRCKVVMSYEFVFPVLMERIPRLSEAARAISSDVVSY